MAMWLSLSLTDSFIREIDFQHRNFLNVENFICITGSSGHIIFAGHSTMKRIMLFSYFIYRRKIKFINAFADSAMKILDTIVFLSLLLLLPFFFFACTSSEEHWLLIHINISSTSTKQNFVWFIVSADIYFKQKRISIVKPLFLIEFPKTRKKR